MSGTTSIVLASATYLAAAGLVARLNGMVFPRTKEAFWQKITAFIFMPANVVLFLLLLAIFALFFWLYPERHRHLFDLEGTDEQRRALADVRAALRQKTLWRRLAERLRLAPRVGPEWPPRFQ
jgi:hypothetical protein